jgi:hypothetical protein
MPFAAATDDSDSPGATVWDPAAGALAGAGDEAGATVAPAAARAAAPSETVGTLIVAPTTTFASSESPLNTATVLVVRLLDAAIDHRVSPG